MSEAPAGAPGQPLDVFVVAGEESGDQLGYKLMRALRAATGGAVTFRGVGGRAMEAEGLQSLFPMSDVAVMGFLPVIKRLPQLLARIRQTADAVVARPPDVLVIIDSPDLTHRVARRARAALPDLPVVDYVSPTVWAWRPGRAAKMRAYVDHLLALLPFEPAAHERLGGPPCTYVGHPLVERLADLRPGPEEAAARAGTLAGAWPTLLVLPGSRRSEIERLSDDFGGAIARVVERCGPLDIVLPAVAHLEGLIREKTALWPQQPRIVLGEAAKYAAFRRARAALAASGTVTLELALAQVPMVVAYKISPIETLLRFVVSVPSIVLPNLILGQNEIPEILQEKCDADALAGALAPIIEGGPEREAQLAALVRLDAMMAPPEGQSPSARAARIVIDTASRVR
ncbi:MAG: lipid-A-disaccharide synthase [Beijerinckiaceae bacterium]|nr:lipid-A-disaccharide synthase [Beijerinckiaceae bacterium]